MAIYHKFATVYDHMGADSFSTKMVAYCARLFKRHTIKPSRGLDLCCGTGTAVKLFSEMGISMAGLDQSASMLAIARNKLKGQPVIFYQKELPKFRILDRTDSGKTVTFDLVTSFYDSLNYMPNESKLKTAFQSVNAHLEPEGWFIFDMNTPEALKTIWDEQTYAGVKDEMAWVWRNEYDAKKKQATCFATFFNKQGKLYERFDEAHVETAYRNTTIKRLLKESGFVVRGFYDCLTFEKPTKNAYRICAVAQNKQN